MSTLWGKLWKKKSSLNYKKLTSKDVKLNETTLTSNWNNQKDDEIKFYFNYTNDSGIHKDSKDISNSSWIDKLNVVCYSCLHTTFSWVQTSCKEIMVRAGIRIGWWEFLWEKIGIHVVLGVECFISIMMNLYNILLHLMFVAIAGLSSLGDVAPKDESFSPSRIKYEYHILYSVYMVYCILSVLII